MGHGILQAGKEVFDEEEWHNNTMPALHNGDVIHVYRIRLSKELRMMGLAYLWDLVLKRLLDIGNFDWKSSNSIAGPIQGMSYLAVLMSRVLPCILNLEDKVGSVELSWLSPVLTKPL